MNPSGSPPPTSLARGADLRRAFLDFFAARDHRAVRSSPLVPRDDPTLLFANAGMNQFKEFFLGRQEPEHPRAVSVQKCVRAGGKHNDLENVGFTARHHTFFEMLGNFSFGDYFKERAIALAWEFLTGALGLAPERLSVTIFAGDDSTPRDSEAERLWRAFVPEERLSALPAAENFWAMGDTGPCGPCSEIHYDQGPDFPGEDRFLEIWNLVFMQFDREEGGRLTPLPAPSVDTGMGLERLAAVMQGVPSNYETDLFTPLISAVRGRAPGEAAPESVLAASRVIADHARAAAFLIADGVLPGNDGRGYVLRKILRRALRFGRKARLEGPFLADFTELAIAGMEGAWPELGRSRDLVRRVSAFEEERFSGAVATAMTQLDRVLARGTETGASRIAGEDAFRLYDTFGLPLDLVEEVARENGLVVDRDGFEQQMEKQRERARRSWRGAPAPGGTAYRAAVGDRESRFRGYRETETEGAEVLALFPLPDDGLPDDDRSPDGRPPDDRAPDDRNAAPVTELRAGREGEIILDPTPFYPEGGGQVGDRGRLRGESGAAEVLDTHSRDGLVIHRVRVLEGTLGRGQRLEAFVDRERRRGAAGHHTMTHLLHAALRDLLGLHVKQAGSLVAPDRLRFDFTHFAPLTPGEIEILEARVNEQIRANREVLASVLPFDDALRRGALAFFGDRYGAEVRVIEVPEFSIELCGGTHLGATGEAGLFVIVSEESVSAGVRRLEALTGGAALDHLLRGRRLLREVSRAARSAPAEAAERVARMRADLKRAEREARRLSDELARRRLSPGANGEAAETPEGSVRRPGIEDIGGVEVWLPEPLRGASQHEHRRLVDAFRDRRRSGNGDGGPWVAVSANVREGRAAVIAAVSPDLEGALPADRLLREAVAAIGGRGGGKSHRAEGGGPNPDGLPALRERVREAVRRIRKTPPSGP